MHKLSVQAPPKALVERYMVEIAKTYNVPFEPDPTVMQHDEILMAENLLIDLDADDKKNQGRGGGGGGGGGMRGGVGVPQPMNYPPYNAAAHQAVSICSVCFVQYLLVWSFLGYPMSHICFVLYLRCCCDHFFGCPISAMLL